MYNLKTLASVVLIFQFSAFAGLVQDYRSFQTHAHENSISLIPGIEDSRQDASSGTMSVSLDMCPGNSVDHTFFHDEYLHALLTQEAASLENNHRAAHLVPLLDVEAISKQIQMQPVSFAK